jgi:hypothetical protein
MIVTARPFGRRAFLAMRPIRFRFGFRLATTHQLPGSCFEKSDATLVCPLRFLPFGKSLRRSCPLMPHQIVTSQFEVLLTVLSDSFSAFTRVTNSLSVSSYI